MNSLAIPIIHSTEAILVVVWLTYVFRTITGEKVATINSISPQPWGVVMVTLGFGMLISCKKWGIDTTIAGGVIGAGVNMLTGKHTEGNDLPPGSTVSKQETVNTPPTT